MIGFSDHYTPFPAISVSTLCAFSRCPRKFFYSFGVGIGRDVESLAMKFGEAIHASLPSAFFGDLPSAMEHFSSVWQNRVGDEKRNTSNALLILKDYMNSHSQNRSIYKLQKPPSGALRLSDQISDYEIPFVLDIGLSVPLVGRIDAWALHRDTGDPWGIEFKTSSEISTRFFDGFQLSPQPIAYTLALRAFGIPAKGVIVEGIKVSSAKKDAQVTLSSPIYVTDQMIEDFLIWAKTTASFMLACQSSKEFPKDLSACSPYPQFGAPGYQCEFLPLCLTSDWTRLLPMFPKRDYPTFRLLDKEPSPISPPISPPIKDPSPPLTKVTLHGKPIASIALENNSRSV